MRIMSQPERYILKNTELAVSIIPDEGGRVASLVSQRSGLEFLTQSQVDRKPLPLGPEVPFQEGPCAGIEECLPTIGPCGTETDGGAAPDHGDFWRLSWDVEG